MLTIAGGQPLSTLNESQVALAGIRASFVDEVRAALRDPERLDAARQRVLDALVPGACLLGPDAAGLLPGLGDLPDPPLVLATTRSLSELHGKRRVGIVGSRKATSRGRSFGRALARSLGEAGVVIVSGAAEGIDTAAHTGAIEAGGTTVAVLGNALASELEKRPSHISWLMAEATLLTETMVPGPVGKWMYPRRNRIVAALSEVLVVVEGSARSGALITAEWSARLGRPVLAVPWRIDDLLGQGPLALLAGGARICRGPQDVLATLDSANVTGPAVQQDFEQALAAVQQASTTATAEAVGQPADLSARAKATLRALQTSGDALHVDEVARSAALTTTDLAAAVIELEIKGLCRRKAGGHIALCYPPSKG